MRVWFDDFVVVVVLVRTKFASSDFVPETMNDIDLCAANVNTPKSYVSHFYYRPNIIITTIIITSYRDGQKNVYCLFINHRLCVFAVSFSLSICLTCCVCVCLCGVIKIFS